MKGETEMKPNTQPQHTPEPWVKTWPEHRPVIASGNTGLAIEFNEPNIDRAAACVNACKGIPTEALESGVIAEMLSLVRDIRNFSAYYTQCECEPSYIGGEPCIYCRLQAVANKAEGRA
jgi:hypothetical protein